MANKSKMLHVPIEPKVREKLRQIASSEENTSLATIVRRAINVYLEGLEQSSKEQAAS